MLFRVTERSVSAAFGGTSNEGQRLLPHLRRSANDAEAEARRPKTIPPVHGATSNISPRFETCSYGQTGSTCHETEIVRSQEDAALFVGDRLFVVAHFAL